MIFDWLFKRKERRIKWLNDRNAFIMASLLGRYKAPELELLRSEYTKNKAEIQRLKNG